MASAVSGDFSGLRRMAAKLHGLSIANQAGVLKAGMRAETKAIAADARSRATKDEGDLKASMGDKVLAYEGGAVVVGLIGPRKGKWGPGKGGRRVRKRGKEGGKQPANYAHLVEKGHRMAAATGRNVRENKGKTFRKGTLQQTGYVLPRPFLGPAFQAGQASLESGLRQATAAAMNKELSKLK